MRLGRQIRRILGDFQPQLVVLRLPIHGVDRDQERKDSGALDVPEKLQAESLAFMGAFDDAGDVGDYERSLVTELNDAEVGLESRERIVGDLGARSGDDRK